VCLIIGSVLNVVALGFGNQLLLSSTSSLSIIFNAILSAFILKEHLYISDLFAIGLISLGTVFFLIIADEKQRDSEGKSDEYDSLQTLRELYLSIKSLSFLGVSLVFVLLANLKFASMMRQLISRRQLDSYQYDSSQRQQLL